MFAVLSTVILLFRCIFLFLVSESFTVDVQSVFIDLPRR